MTETHLAADLVSLLNEPTVSHPTAAHKYECRYWREGKSHGPCTCGAQELDARIRKVLVDVGVEIQESPAQMHERDSLTITGTMCAFRLRRAETAWVCDGCGWTRVMP